MKQQQKEKQVIGPKNNPENKSKKYKDEYRPNYYHQPDYYHDKSNYYNSSNYQNYEYTHYVNQMLKRIHNIILIINKQMNIKFIYQLFAIVGYR